MFKVGQQVYVYGRGNGRVVEVTGYSVTVWFHDKVYRTFYDYVDIEVIPDDDTPEAA